VPVDVSREVRPAAPPRRLPKAIPVEDVERLLDALPSVLSPSRSR